MGALASSSAIAIVPLVAPPAFSDLVFAYQSQNGGHGNAGVDEVFDFQVNLPSKCSTRTK